MHWTEIVERRIAGAVVLDVRGQLTLSEEDASLFRQVSRLVGDGVRRVVLNLGHVSYIDSVGVGEIVRSYMLVTQRGGMLVLCEVGPRVRELLETTNLDSVLRFFDTESEAVEHADAF
jgi:anti-sigma B factor antagonist